jgi:hypothetical protein
VPPASLSLTPRASVNPPDIDERSSLTANRPTSGFSASAAEFGLWAHGVTGPRSVSPPFAQQGDSAESRPERRRRKTVLSSSEYAAKDLCSPHHGTALRQTGSGAPTATSLWVLSTAKGGLSADRVASRQRRPERPGRNREEPLPMCSFSNAARGRDRRDMANDGMIPSISVVAPCRWS